MKDLIESALFISGRRMTLEELSKLDETASIEAIEAEINALKEGYAARESPIQITFEEGGYKMELHPKYVDKVQALAPHMDLPIANLKILSHIAFKQPITQHELVEMFGNRVYDYVKDLLHRGFIKSVPHRHTRMLSTTKKLHEFLGEEDSSKIKARLLKARLEAELKQKLKDTDSEAEERDLRAELRKKKDLSVEEWMEIAKRDKHDEDLKKLEDLEAALEKQLGVEEDEE